MRAVPVLSKVVWGLAICLLVTGRGASARAQAPFWRTALGVAAQAINNAHERETPHDIAPPHAEWLRPPGPHEHFDTFDSRELGLRLEVAPPHGLVVREVVRNSTAQRAGLEVGDIILRLAGREIDCRDDFLRALRSDEREWTLLVRDGRSGRVASVRVCLPEPPIDLCGTWCSDLGHVQLTQTGDQLRGTLDLLGANFPVIITGHVHGNTAHVELSRGGRCVANGEWTIVAGGRKLDGTLTLAAHGTVREFDLVRE